MNLRLNAFFTWILAWTVEEESSPVEKAVASSELLKLTHASIKYDIQVGHSPKFESSWSVNMSSKRPTWAFPTLNYPLPQVLVCNYAYPTVEVLQVPLALSFCAKRLGLSDI